jgi:hypothetical protein
MSSYRLAAWLSLLISKIDFVRKMAESTTARRVPISSRCIEIRRRH